MEDAWTITELKELDPWASWSEIAMHPDSALPDWPAVVLNDDEERDWTFGRTVSSKGEICAERARVYNSIGEWIGLAEYNPSAAHWRPLRVIGQS
jgi:hypothetical protein